MPANLTPEYDKAEQQYREAQTAQEKLEGLRAMLRAIPKHKGTEKMQADLKRRISQSLKVEAKKGASRGPDPFHVPKGGAGQVVLIGPPNVGKSMLVATTTNAHVKVADYPFATPVPVPGMWRFEDTQIQLVDTPPVTADHVPVGLMGTVRPADVIAVVVDAAGEPLEEAEMILGVMADRNVALRSAPRHALDATDAAQHSGVILANKVDRARPEDIATLGDLYAGTLEVIPVSAASGEGLGELLERLWQLLAIVRVYTKQPGRPPDNDKPFTLDLGSTVEDLAAKVHRELPEKMKYARIWGDGRFSGQQVHRTEPLRDKDIVEIHE